MRKPLLVLLVQFVAIHAVFAQLEIETTVPTGFDEAINVGVGEGLFQTIVRNTGTSTIEVNGLQILHTRGLEITSANCEFYNETYNMSYTGNSIVTGNPIDLLPGQEITYSYTKRASCDIVPEASSGYSLQVIDTIIVLTNENGTSYSGQSNSYPILIPGLSVIVPESPYNNKVVVFHDDFKDTITIKNEANAGHVKNLVIQMEYSKDILSVNTIEICANGNTLSFSTQQDVIELNSSDLEQLGFQNGIMPSNSQIQMIVSGRVENYATTTQVRYSVDFKAFDSKCGHLKNAEGVKYFQQTSPNPQMEVDLYVVEKGNFCGKSAIVDVICRNYAIDIPANLIMDGYISISYSTISIEKVEVEGQELVKSERGYELPKKDGAIYSELKGGDSVTFRLYVNIPERSYYQRTMMYCYFHGKDISGKDLSNFSNTNDEIYDVQSSIEGPATLDTKKKPNGIYTCSCKAKRIPMDNTMLVDYDMYAYIGGVEYKKLTFDSMGEIKDTFSTNIQACTSDDIQLEMVIKSDGCQNYIPIRQTEANVVQRCWENGIQYTRYPIKNSGSGSGSGFPQDEDDKRVCTDMYVDTTALSTQKTTACDSVNIVSKAVVTYSCSNIECAAPKNIVVKFFDHNKQLDKLNVADVKIGDITGTPVNYIEPNSIFYKCDYTNKCDQGTEEISDTILITANLKMPKTHLEETRTDANIQVGVGYIHKDTMNISPFSWGEELSIFDATPNFESSVDLGHCDDCCIYVNLPNTGYEGVSSIVVNKVEFPGFEYSYYPNKPVYTPVSSTVNDHIRQGEQQLYKTNIFPQCAPDGYKPDTKAVTIWYTDFADKTCQREVVKNVYVSSYDMEYKSADIHIYPTERQQAIGQTTTWTVRVVNEGSYRAEHVMLKFTINPENTMALYLEEFMMGANIIDDYQEFGGSFYVPIGRINKGEEKDLKISVSYGKCAEEGISIINVESAWSCESLSPQNFDNFNCGGSTILELENMVAVLSAVETYPKEYFNLCEEIPIHLTIDNIGRADLTQLGFWFIKDEETYTITDNEINREYKGGKGVVSQNMEISDMKINLYNENSILSIIPLKYDNNNYSNSDVFNPLKASEKINLNFNLQQHCSSNQYQTDTVKFSVRAFTNCGNKQEKEFQFIPKLKGFEQLDSIFVTSSTTGFTEYKGMTEVLISINNTTNTLIDSAYISVILPKGFEYIDYTPIDNSIITGLYQSSQSDGTILLQWELEQGRHLAAQDSVMISVRIRATDDCANTATLLTMCTLKRQMADCDGNICKVAQSTEAQRIMLVPIKKDNEPVLSGQESVCAGNPVEYMIEGKGIQNITWQFSDENTNINSSSENSVQVIFPQANTITLSVSIDGDCEDYKLTKTITVSDVPNVQLPDTIRVKWNALNALLDSLYTIGQWDSPFVINECGNYYKTVSKENQCGLANKNVVLRVTDCCDTVTVGDIVETELQGITTYDAFLLRYYLKHRGALQPTSDETFQLHLRDNICEEKIVPLRECFEKRADMNKDGVINEVDVKLLQDIIK